MQEQIFDALRRGAHDQALAMAREAVAATPGQAQPHRWLAMAQEAAGDHDAALASIDRAIALAPEDADLHFHRAGYLLGKREVEAAQAALSQSVQLDPNQFGAYVLQAQLAVARGDLEECQRLSKLAARIAPGHPWLRMLEGTLALQRGEADSAISLLSSASRQAPEDAQIRYVLGFAYLQKGHLAFAEHAFNSVLGQSSDGDNLRALIADLQRRQGRFDDAADTLAPLLAAADAAPALQRLGGQLELAAGRPERALPLLRAALAAQPEDPLALAGMLELWQRSGDRDDARRTLDAALATSPQAEGLWRARVAIEAVDGEEVMAVLDRWLAAAPDALAALDVQMHVYLARGDRALAEAAARRILEQAPDYPPAHRCLVDGLLRSDARMAVAHLNDAIARSEDADIQRLYRGWLGIAQDSAGYRDKAVQTWLALQAETGQQRMPPPAPAATADAPLPAPAAVAADTPPVAFLIGAPGASVERVATLLAGCLPAFRGDRFQGEPPRDELQRLNTAVRLVEGQVTPEAVARSWYAQLPARGLPNAQVIDWLPWWDNALLAVLRGHIPQAQLIVALRDPRDMLLDWLVFGAPFRFESAEAAATWMARYLEQIAAIEENDLLPRTLLRMDAIVNDEAAVAQALGEVLQSPLPEPPAGLFGAPRFASGRWREYAQALAQPFATLAPVARRLGYSDT
ncbi:tetratricopeptide repeat protein [Luteimonas aquatica]|uniref:tetratricopeptide repeat protein n=1 Tax=Luteimonas aquatica TaxID=450364 RepID=UPI001F5A7E70|nr:tetratricopeptide repeat protein [Luteimonas aquatica]